MSASPLRILHCVRSPVGGTFRHIVDLAREQHRAGHSVGIALDTAFGGAFEQGLVAAALPFLRLGVTPMPVSYSVGPGDLVSVARAIGVMGRLRPDVVHGHGAKGGLFGRVAALALRLRGARVASFYTPHGGSLHHDASRLAGRLYFAAERLLERGCDGIFHVSRFEQEQYRAKIGMPRCPSFVVLNGLRAEEFEPVTPHADAADVAVMGMFRDLKGQDVLLRALAAISARTGASPTAQLIGEGPDEALLRALAGELGLEQAVRFAPLMPTREGFARTRILVVPSRAESLPYIVLEAAAAGLPLLASRVGGIPEILGDASPCLVPAGDAQALSVAIERTLGDLAGARSRAAALSAAIRSRFSVEAMASAIEDAYRAALARREGKAGESKRLQPAE